jgi:hypothetical protein
VNPEYGMAVMLPGALGLVGCMSLTKYVHFRNIDSLQGYAWALTVLWGITAVVYGSSVIGFITIMALMSALGFIMGMIPGVVYMGFNDEDFIPQTTISAGVITAMWVALHITGQTDKYIDVFKAGMMFCGTFVYFLGMLIWSSKWCCYHKSSDYHYRSLNVLKYLTLQAVMIVSGVLAIYIGTVYSTNFLLGIGGPVFYIYLIEKYYEIPWEGKGWAWSTLGLAGILYIFAVFAKTHPTYFAFWT